MRKPSLAFNLIKIFLQKLIINELKCSVKPNDHTNNLLTRVKGKINILGNYNLVYKINCINCKKYYIGYTTTYLKIRLKHHKYILKPN